MDSLIFQPCISSGNALSFRWVRLCFAANIFLLSKDKKDIFHDQNLKHSTNVSNYTDLVFPSPALPFCHCIFITLKEEVREPFVLSLGVIVMYIILFCNLIVLDCGSHFQFLKNKKLLRLSLLFKCLQNGENCLPIIDLG